MSRRTSPPFRADHAGSLLRPRRLLQARDDTAAGLISAAELRAVEDQEIPAAVRMQEEVGLQSATDGEFRRTTWHMDFIDQLGGISKAPGNLAVTFTNPTGTIVPGELPVLLPDLRRAGRQAPPHRRHRPGHLGLGHRRVRGSRAGLRWCCHGVD